MIAIFLSLAFAAASLLLLQTDFSGSSLTVLAFLTMASATAVFAWRASLHGVQTLLPSWGFMALFWLNYPLQYVTTLYLASLDFGDQLLRSLTLRPVWGMDNLREDSLRIMAPALCFMALGLVSRMELLHSKGFRRLRGISDWTRLIEWNRQGERRTQWMLLLLSLAVVAIALPLQLTWGIGSLANQSHVDFRLGGLLYQTLVTLIPLVLLSVHIRSSLCRYPGLAVAAIVAYLGLGLIEAVMMSSRGYLALRMVEVVMLYSCLDRYRKRSAGWLLGAVVIAVTLYPMITSIRNLRSGMGLSALESVRAAWEESPSSDGQIQATVLAASRFIGFTSLMVSVGYGGDPFPWDQVSWERALSLRESSFTRWYTEHVAGYGIGVRGHFSAPGLLGAGLLLGGPWFALCAPMLLACVAQSLYERWGVLSRIVGPLVSVALLESALLLFNEGTLDISFTRIAITWLSLALLAVVTTAFRPSAKAKA